MKKRYGIVFPSETFDTLDEATEYAAKLVSEEDISAGVYVFAAQEIRHFKADKKVRVKRCRISKAGAA